MWEKGKIVKEVIRYVSVLFFGIIIGAVLLIIVYTLPTETMRFRAKEARNVFSRESSYYNVLDIYRNTTLDNFTDAILLGEAIYNGEESAIEKGMMVYRWSTSAEYTNPVDDFIVLLNDQSQTRVAKEYSRYWHGVLVFLKPLLLLFNYSQIRYLNISLLTFLFVFIVLEMNKNDNLRVFIVGFTSSWMLVFPFILGMSIQFMSVTVISLLGSVLVMRYEKHNEVIPYIFIVIGMLTSYFDLLTFPVLTLCLPLSFFTLLNDEKTIKARLLKIFGLVFLWFFGYFGMWFGKWVIGSILCRKNLFILAFQRAAERTAASTGRLSAVFENIEYYVNKVSVFIIIFTALFCVFNKHKAATKSLIPKIICLMIIGSFPILWYFVFSHHSIVHSWFTNKALVGFFFSIFSILTIISVYLREKKQ